MSLRASGWAALAAVLAAWASLLAAAPAVAGGPVPVTCGQLHAGTLTGPGDVAEFSFQGLPGEVVSIAAWRTDGSGSLPQLLFRPDGSMYAGPIAFRQIYTLTQDGTGATPHRIEITTGGAAGGDFVIQVLWLSERAECQDPLACGVQETETLTSEWHWRTWSFEGASGQPVAFQTWRTGGDAGFSPRWRIYRPDGTWLQAAFEPGLDLDPTEVLDTNGIHTVVVKSENSAVGDLAAQLLRLEDSVNPAFASCGPLLLCGQALGLPAASQGETTEIAPAREWETFRVDALAGEVIGLSTWRTAGDVDFQPEHRVLDRSGAPLGSFTTGFQDWALPLDAGTYTVAVKNLDSPPRSGEFGIEVWRLSQARQCAPVMPCGMVELVDHTVPGSIHTRQFDASAGDDVAVETRFIAGSGFAAEATVFAPDGSTVAPFQAGRIAWTAGQTGTHTIVVRATNSTSTGTFALFWEGLSPGNLCTVADADADSVPDQADNCPADPNPAQADADGDLVGDDCDNCPSDANFDQTDSDADSFGDACEPTEQETKCLVKHLKVLGKMCKSAFSCESKRVKKPSKDPTGSARDACLDKAEERFEKIASKALNKLGPCLMPANYLTVATTLGSDALALGDSVLQGIDEADPVDTKTRSKIVGSLGKGCLTRLKADGKAVKKGTPLTDSALTRFASACDKAVVGSAGAYDGAACSSLATLLEVLLEDLQNLARGR